MEDNTPDRVPYTCIKTGEVVHGFSNASGRGLESVMNQAGSNKLHVRIRIWAMEEEEEESQNWTELTNVVEAIESEGKAGQLNGTMIFMFTDNSTVKGEVLRAESPLKKIFGLVLRIKRC